MQPDFLWLNKHVYIKENIISVIIDTESESVAEPDVIQNKDGEPLTSNATCVHNINSKILI